MTVSTTSPDIKEDLKERSQLSTALLIALFPVTAAAIRIWVYSGGDTVLFLVLLRTLDIPAVLIGTMILMIPSLLAVFAVMALLNPDAGKWARHKIVEHRFVSTIVLPVVLIVIAYTVSWPTFVLLGSIGVIALIFSLIRNSVRESREKKTGVKHQGKWKTDRLDTVIPIVTAMILFLVGPSSMWLPLEQVKVADQKQRTAYVLDSSSEWTTLLTSDRKVEVIHTDQVESREVCNVKNAGTFALFIQHGGLNGGPDCT